ncbi:hypothetical protein PO878_20215 [Iamia majanohamensis]|uniref:Uncharacterized protein n=1 Tax=Iamia majanohamensis TaxID=467976 RepID=A0AAE9YFF2_9ACTN|nr:hypothetical protein [Iamia majanohamensis]WCO66821.1 hypothetical protein PO878_20215 [Iamia majanohamensis]
MVLASDVDADVCGAVQCDEGKGADLLPADGDVGLFDELLLGAAAGRGGHPRVALEAPLVERVDVRAAHGLVPHHPRCAGQDAAQHVDVGEAEGHLAVARPVGDMERAEDEIFVDVAGGRMDETVVDAGAGDIVDVVFAAVDLLLGVGVVPFLGQLTGLRFALHLSSEGIEHGGEVGAVADELVSDARVGQVCPRRVEHAHLESDLSHDHAERGAESVAIGGVE